MQIPGEALAAGAARFGLTPGDLKHLGGMDGAAYEYRRDGRPLVLKVAPLPAEEVPALRAKLDFVRYLGANGVRVSRPVESVAGTLVETLEADGQHYVASAAEKAVGHHPVNQHAGDLTNPALVREWGRTLGQMHRLTKGYVATGPLGDWRGEYEFMAGRCPDEAVRARWREVRAYLDTLPQSPDCFGVLHNDLHQWNFVVSGLDESPEITAFDFDCCNRHWFVAELGLAVFHALWEGPHNPLGGRAGFARWFLDNLLAGYSTENTLDEFWVAQVPRFVEYRRLLLYSVFAEEWGKSANPWMREQVAGWRQGILAGLPVVAL